MKLKKILPVIGILIFIYILSRLDVRNIIHEISNANLFLLLAALFFTFVFLWTQTLKWFAIARVQKIKIPFFKSFMVNLKSLLYAFVTPSNIGGVIRADYLRKYADGKLGKGVSNFTLDKIFDLLGVTLIAIFGLLFFGRFISEVYFYYTAGFLFLLFVFLMIFTEPAKSKKILRIFYKFFPDKIKQRAREGFYSFYQDIPGKKYFAFFLLLNIMNWVVFFIGVYFVGLSLGIKVSFAYYLVILPIATFVSKIPITVNGLGTREAVLIGLFGLVGVEATKVFSMSVLNLFIAGVLPALVGSFFLFKRKS